MDILQIGQLISTIGFPVVLVLILLRYISKKDKEYIDNYKAITENNNRKHTEFIQSLTELKNLIQKLINKR